MQFSQVINNWSFIFRLYIKFTQKIFRKKFIHLEEEQIELINSYSKDRIYSLKNNIEEAIKNDLINNRTIFLEKNLYTYAEIYLYSN